MGTPGHYLHRENFHYFLRFCFSFALERFIECLNLLQAVKPLRSFYIAKLELTSYHRVNISVCRVVDR